MFQYNHRKAIYNITIHAHTHTHTYKRNRHIDKDGGEAMSILLITYKIAIKSLK